MSRITVVRSPCVPRHAIVGTEADALAFALAFALPFVFADTLELPPPLSLDGPGPAGRSPTLEPATPMTFRPANRFHHNF